MTATKLAPHPGTLLAIDLDDAVLLRGPDVYRQSNGSAGGDVSIGDEFSACFIWALPDSTFYMVESTYFIAAHVVAPDEVTDLDFSDWEHLTMTGDPEGSDPDPERLDQLRYSVKCQTITLRCTDPDDPGSTEITSDYDSEDMSSVWIMTLDAAYDSATAWVNSERADNYSPTRTSS